MQAQDQTPQAGSTVLVTGFPIYVARRLARELVAGGDRVLLLHREKFARDAEAFATEVNAAASASGSGGRIEPLWGDILDIDLGVSGAEVRRLQADVEEIYHVAAVQYLAIDSAKMRNVNVEGLRELLELALGMRKLRRICHWSTAFVAGDRSGVAYEHELRVGQHLRNDYEVSKAEAEELARAAMAKLPITIVRPAIVVGDSVSGEVQRFDGPTS